MASRALCIEGVACLVGRGGFAEPKARDCLFSRVVVTLARDEAYQREELNMSVIERGRINLP